MSRRIGAPSQFPADYFACFRDAQRAPLNIKCPTLAAAQALAADLNRFRLSLRYAAHKFAKEADRIVISPRQIETGPEVYMRPRGEALEDIRRLIPQSTLDWAQRMHEETLASEMKEEAEMNAMIPETNPEERKRQELKNLFSMTEKKDK